MSRTNAAHEDDVGSELTWSVHLARMKPRRSAGAAAIAVLFLGLMYWGTQELSFIAVAALALVVALNSFIFPIRYRLDDRGVALKTVLGTQTFKWRRFKDYYYHGDCMELSFGRRDIRSRILRAVYLYYPPEGEMKDVIIQRALRGMGEIAEGDAKREDTEEMATE